MEFRKVLALRGPNIWANFPVLEAWVDLGALKDSSSDELPGFNERLKAWLPTLVEHRCSVGTRGGFFERLRRGTYQAHILEHVALELQSLAGTEVGFGRTRETSQEGVYKVALEYEDEELGRACLEAARALCLAAVQDRPCDVPAEVERLRALARRLGPAPGTAAVIRAARKRQVPVRQLSPEGLLLLGQGARQRRVLGGRTDQTGALAESTAGDVGLTRDLLRAVGVPVPSEDSEDKETRRQGDRETGRQGDQEKQGPEGQAATGNQPVSLSPGLLVPLSPCLPRWRLLVVGGQVVAATGLDPVGDVTNRVHPEVAARAAEAARAVGLDVAGIDVVAADPGRPLEEQGGVVTAVHANPDLGLHGPSAGEAIVGELFPEGQTGRIPTVAVTGVNGKTTTTRLIAHAIARTQRCVGMTCTEGIYIDGRRIEAGDCSGPLSARAVLQNPAVEAAVLETARGGILRAGLGFDRCDVAVVTNIAEGDHLGVADIETPEQLARVKRTVVDVVGPNGAAVLKADDPLVADMAAHCRGSVVFFARDGEHPTLTGHRARGGRVAFARGRRLILAEGEVEIPLVGLERVPLTHGGRVPFQVENALAAAAAAWSLGVPCEAIRTALETFTSHLDQVPVRFNLLEVNGATAVLDYGHNTSSLSCLLEALEQLPHPRRSAVYSAAGDRRDGDLIRQGELLGDAFDRVILYEEEHCVRGRRDGEIIALFRRGLSGRRRVKKIEEVQGAVRAVEVALESGRPGELLLVQVDRVDETVELVRRLLASGAAVREIDFREALAAARPAEVAVG
jgi:cyanophycin synthetase